MVAVPIAHEERGGASDVGEQMGKPGQIVQAVPGCVGPGQGVELAADEDKADAGEHPVDDGGRDGTEPAAEADQAQADLEEARGEDDDAERRDAVGGHGLVHQDRESGGRAAHLQGAARHRTDQEPADNPGDQAEFGGDSGGYGDTDAQGDGDEEDDDRGQDVAGKGLRPQAQLCGGHEHFSSWGVGEVDREGATGFAHRRVRVRGR